MIAEAVKPYHVLLVEDDLGDALLIEEALADSELVQPIEHVTDGQAALDRLREESARRPDLIVLDLNMPRMGGAELLSILKADEELRPIPVVVLTTSAAPTDITTAYRDHANAYVVKPTGLDDFTQAVRSIDTFYRETAVRPPLR